MAAVLQSECALNEQQGHLKCDAEVAIIYFVQPVGTAGSDVFGVFSCDYALDNLVGLHPVVVQDGDTGDSEQGAEGKRLRPKGDAAQ